MDKHGIIDRAMAALGVRKYVDLANFLGVSSAVLSSWRHRKESRPDLNIIVEAFKTRPAVDIGYILTGKRQQQAAPSKGNLDLSTVKSDLDAAVSRIDLLESNAAYAAGVEAELAAMRADLKRSVAGLVGEVRDTIRAECDSLKESFAEERKRLEDLHLSHAPPDPRDSARDLSDPTLRRAIDTTRGGVTNGGTRRTS